MKLLIIYLLLVNGLGYWSMGRDKALAGKGKRRIPERRLFGLALAGGAVGSWLGMRRFRHKTKHSSFVIGIPLLIAVNAVCVYGVWRLILSV
ncbi:Protein of uncharacterised function (DUF1294) [Chlamydia abortus]|uniref:DUF1294 domain-containing protein n=1 Tax=Paenibacillus residui TaxID=629724 RepID=A0ABW3D710_9BACL|nr:DUF1294 domain-containing protein [Paenibacillus sp. 32O-W]SHE10581.1 Protein of uncharacterised function (DUF1294) [Chlamydia abortus]